MKRGLRGDRGVEGGSEEDVEIGMVEGGARAGRGLGGGRGRGKDWIRG
jgi:hypothetical protein